MSHWPDNPARRQDGFQGESSTLNPKSFFPLYLQLTEILKERIEAGEYAYGARFASERELCEEFGVSRTVVRPALQILEDDGQLFRIKGKGTFVAPPKVVDRVQGLVPRLDRLVGHGTEILIVEAIRQKPETYVADILGVRKGRDTIAHVLTRTSIDGRALFICDSYISLRSVPNILGLARVGEVISENREPLLSLELDRPEIRLGTSFATAFESEQLGVSPGAPTLLIRCIEYRREAGKESGALEFARLVYRADIVELEVGAQ